MLCCGVGNFGKVGVKVRNFEKVGVGVGHFTSNSTALLMTNHFCVIVLFNYHYDMAMGLNQTCK